MNERAQHWDRIYATKGENEVSWFEENPELSLALIRSAGVDTSKSVIDIGGGASRLVDALEKAGQSRIAVLDLSEIALQRSRERVASGNIEWIVADVTTWAPARHYDVWHDRAAFHFLIEAEQQQAYVAALRAAVPVGGVAIIGTFAPNGPEKCSGLPVARYSAERLKSVLGDDFALMGQLLHEHRTPWGAVQHFQFSTFRRSA
ncbi:MAG TPA: class I SAM-dependent methyltransferase [Devosia sp.]|nr:class I SAM-dependent methyltransferase [Devosia sp.]